MYKFTLDRLAHLKQVAFFRQDALKDMQALGIDKETALHLIYTESFKNCDIIQWWTDYGDTFGNEILNYLNSFSEK